MQVIFRPFERDDMDPLYFLDQRASPEPHRVSYARLLDALLDPESMALVAVPETGERPRPVLSVLLARLEGLRRRLDVRLLVVDPAFRHQGFARRLLTLAERVGQDLAAQHLAVPQESDGARPFLERMGFSPSEEAVPTLRSEQPATLWLRPVPERNTGEAAATPPTAPPAAPPRELPAEGEAAPADPGPGGEEPPPDGNP